MRDASLDATRQSIALGAIVCGAVLVRLVAAFAQGDDVRPLPGIFDQLSYHALATRVVGGHGFSFAEGHWPATKAGAPTAHWSYLYTLYLAGIYWTAGVHPIVARVLQAVVVGVLHPWLTFRVARHAFGSEVAVLSAALAAVYAYFVYYAGGLLTEAFYFVSVLWVLSVVLRIAAGARSRPAVVSDWLELGMAVGAAVLLRQVFLVTVPIVMGWLWFQLRRSGSVMGPPAPVRVVLVRLALSLAVLATMVAPFTIRNYRAFHALVPLNTNAGFAFYWGNHPVHGSWFKPLLPESSVTYGDLIPADLRHLDEAALDRALLWRAAGIIAGDPGRFARLSLTRVPEFVRFWPSPDSTAGSNIVRIASFGIALPLGLYGGFVWMARLRRRADDTQRAAVWLLAGWSAGYALIHLASWTLIRYRLPIDAVLLPVSALGLRELTLRLKAWADGRGR